MESKKEFIAFISYNHEDIEWAEWLQNKLEFYKLPAFVKEEYPELPEMLRPIFRDVTDLEPGYLSDKIKEALRGSNFLIVICSPNATKSEWVEKEIKEYVKVGKKDAYSGDTRSPIPVISVHSVGNLQYRRQS